jgi:hypothetical protein
VAQQPLMGATADPFLMEHERAVSPSAVQRAALHIQDAFDGTEHVHPREGRALRRLWLVHLALIVPCRLALAGLVLLSFIEQPPWVLEARRHVPNADIETHYPTFGLPMLPVATSLAVEAAPSSTSSLQLLARPDGWWRVLGGHGSRCVSRGICGSRCSSCAPMIC